MASSPDDIELSVVPPAGAMDSRTHDGSESHFTSGIIRFMYDVSASEDTCQYLCVPRDAPSEDVISHMFLDWNLEPPKMILSVLSTLAYEQPWASRKELAAFQIGLSKVVSKSEVWLLTGALDVGVPKTIGDAIAEELIRRKVPEVKIQLRFMSFEKKENLPKIQVIGVQGKKNVAYGNVLDGKHEGELSIENQGQKPKAHRFELNPAHSNFLLIEDVGNPLEVAAFRFRLEQCLRFQSSSLQRENASDAASMSHSSSLIPMVGLLIQGGPVEVERVLDMLKKKIPVVIFKGSGQVADLLAFAYEELQERSNPKRWKSDPEHEKMYVRPELMKRIVNCSNADLQDNEIKQKQCRDRILQCVDFAHQGEETFLTILDMENSAAELKKLDKYILMAIFESQPKEMGTGWHSKMMKDLKLTLNWKCSELACSQVFQKYEGTKIKISDELFEQALLTPGCEDFVELFLDKRCIQAHRFLSPQRLLRLFRHAIDPEFFITVCLEGVLGKTVMNPLEAVTREFVEGDSCELNRLLYKVTRLRTLISPYELAKNSIGDYVTNQSIAEAKAINALIYWAALTYRFDLTKILWKRADNPMTVALVISSMWNNFSQSWCRDTEVMKRLRKSSIEFSEMSLKLLDVSTRDNFLQTVNYLDKKLPNFSNRTILDIANTGRNKYFIAHHVCQKWLSMRWYGHLRIRQLDWGLFKLPDWLKIYLCAFFILPTFLWITFEDKQQSIRRLADDKPDSTEDDDEEEEEKEAEKSWKLKPESEGILTRKLQSIEVHVENFMTRGKTNLKVPLNLQVYYLWTAPVTKFWISQLFYILFLITFSLALVMPSCGNVFLDLVVFVWTLLIWLEIIRRTFLKQQKFPEMPISWTVIEILLVGGYLVLYFFLRIFPHFVQYMDFMTTKFVMSLGLLYFYYRLLVVFLPISPVLGPMLINFKEMLQGDFVIWMRMFLIVMFSGGITIHAVLYPDAPLSFDALKKAFSRAFFAMFLTKIDDLDGDETCSYLYNNDSLTYCIEDTGLNRSIHIGGSHTYMVDGLSMCPYSSFGGYFVVIVYLVVTKLILITLLFALFSATQSKIAKTTQEIWKYQKYTIVLEFEQRLRLPPPFTIFSYITMFVCFIVRGVINCCRWCCKRNIDKPDLPGEVAIHKVKRSEDYCYWRKCLGKMQEEVDDSHQAKNRLKIQQESVNNLVLEMDNQKVTNRIMADRMIRLERGLDSCRLLLEDVKHILVNLDPMMKKKPSKHVAIHIASRQSPYPLTDIQRFPVFDKYVPWTIKYSSYDPVEYTRSVDNFPADVRPVVDPNFLKIKSEIEAKATSIEDLSAIVPQLGLDPQWNSMEVVQVNGVDVEINRRSWMKEGGQPLQYKIDKSGIPRNPRGRTGVCGRGKLWRWGPNHNVRIVVSRWKRKSNNGPSEYMTVEGKHVLEFIVVQREDTGEPTLPYENDFGLTSVYSAMCNRFLSFTADSSKITSKMDKKEMEQFFSKYAKPLVGNTQGFSARIVYCGYLDDPSNTDNAWKEAEVWNFHYANGDTFDEILKEGTKMWREASPYTRLYGNQDSIIHDVARICEAYY